jgi:hypothetical protein
MEVGKKIKENVLDAEICQINNQYEKAKKSYISDHWTQIKE